MRLKTFNEYQKGEKKAIFDAVWQYILDHADITNDGTLFVKFHCKDKTSFAMKIRSRMKGTYRNGEWFSNALGIRRGETIEKRHQEILGIDEQRKALVGLNNRKLKWYQKIYQLIKLK